MEAGRVQSGVLAREPAAAEDSHIRRRISEAVSELYAFRSAARYVARLPVTIQSVITRMADFDKKAASGIEDRPAYHPMVRMRSLLPFTSALASKVSASLLEIRIGRPTIALPCVCCTNPAAAYTFKTESVTRERYVCLRSSSDNGAFYPP